ncbi:hypothetical protein CEXT_170861 [Caerostris extrusa]|uniref:Uncharacterized protein n=1 Tax=Caerostris extrusa TaxID=172846 RepID=A0AAV4XWN9_CAEEX|nr:hypothetical protein CEXT_170861 [Caerostris extrusa]
MYNVESLYLSHNPFTRVTENSFNGKVNNTRYIKLDNCLIQEFNIRHYIKLHKLFQLDLNYNLIDKIINLYKANYMDDYIKISNENKNIPVAYNNSLFYGPALLSLTGNRIAMLRPEDFSQMLGLRSLRLQNNDIGQVDTNSFLFLRNFLQLLDLSQNKIHSLQGCVRFHSALRFLNLTDNRIEQQACCHCFSDLVRRIRRPECAGNPDAEQQPHHHAGQQFRETGEPLEILRVDSNRLRTLGKEQIPANLQELYLAECRSHILRADIILSCDIQGIIQVTPRKTIPTVER